MRSPERYSTARLERKVDRGPDVAFLLFTFALIASARSLKNAPLPKRRMRLMSPPAFPIRPRIFVMHKFATAALFAIVFSLPAISQAAALDATAPVKTIMDATVSNWAGGDSEWQDIFDDGKLSQLYSKDFAAKYQAAAKFPAAGDDGISPFDYDVIVDGQDACPLEDLTITPHAPSNGTTEVVAQFKKSTCMGKDAEYQAYSSVRFEVIEEDSKPVIDDIVTMDENGKVTSVKDVMQSIVKQQ
jgi:hypothetical protein